MPIRNSVCADIYMVGLSQLIIKGFLTCDLFLRPGTYRVEEERWNILYVTSTGQRKNIAFLYG